VYYQSPKGASFSARLLGDSITSPGSFAGSNWATIVSIENTVPLRIIDHASAGETIITHMDAQTAEACNDYADLIFIALGTNDNNAGNMTTLQAEVEENIAELKSTNPVATIYYLNVLPCWTDETGDVEVDKSNIRTAIAAACATQGVTCWDTYTDPWITADQTVDGVHPNAAGHAAIAAEVLALLS